jgi:gliding-associated putative ABC transporter substrate-binding component GldG
MTKKQTTIVTILILVIIALSALISRRLWFRLDLTKGKTYTISEVSRNLHNEIPDQIRITYYLSDKLKSLHPIPGEIEDLLREYAAYSRGKIQLSVRDPAKAQLTSQVEQLGIMPQQIQTVEQDQASVMTVYTGILIEYLDEIDVLPVVFSLETLEYDLTSRIRALVRGSARMLGVMVGNPGRWNEEYRYLQNAYMQAGYRLRLISPGEEIPETVPALVVLGGVDTFDETALYQIDRYIQAGGKAFFTVKSVQLDTDAGFSANLLEDSGLLSMIAHYGASVLPEIVMDRSALTMQYQTRTPNGAIQIRFARYPQWIRILSENGNPQHPVSAKLPALDLYWANPIELNAPQGVEADWLFTTTDEAWTMGEPFYTSPDVPYLLERDAASTKGKKTVGASLSGIFPSWFGGMKPETEGVTLPDMPAEAKPSRIIVIGETEFATAFLNVTGGQSNLNFLVQAADWLCNDDDIIGIRSRESGSGRLDRITDPEKRAIAMQLARLVNVFLMPLLVILIGIFLALRRRAKSRSLADETAVVKSVDNQQEISQQQETLKEPEDAV